MRNNRYSAVLGNAWPHTISASGTLRISPLLARLYTFELDAAATLECQVETTHTNGLYPGMTLVVVNQSAATGRPIYIKDSSGAFLNFTTGDFEAATPGAAHAIEKDEFSKICYGVGSSGAVRWWGFLAATGPKAVVHQS